MDGAGASSQTAVHFALERMAQYIASNPQIFSGASGHLYLFTPRSGDGSGVFATNVTVTTSDPGGGLVLRLDMDYLAGKSAEIANGLAMLRAYVREASNYGASPWGNPG